MKRSPLSRNTPLTARSELKRKAELRRTAPDRTPREPQLPKRARRITVAARYTGPDKATRKLVRKRDGNRCILCGQNGSRYGIPIDLHHRRPRGLGGSQRPDTNQPQNLILLDRICHEWVERNREAALYAGLLVPQWADPALVSLRIAPGRWVLLTPAGTYEPVQERSA